MTEGSRWIRFGELDEVRRAGRLARWVDNQEVLAFFQHDKLVVMSNVCLHKGGPLNEGQWDGSTVTCPWHGWRYEVATGKCLGKARCSLPAIAHKVEEGIIHVCLGPVQ